MTSNNKNDIHVATVTAPTNIACIKYWGKSDVKLNTPLNSSLSATISQKHLRAVTTASASASFSSHRLWLNGIEEDVRSSKRFNACLEGILRLAGDKVDSDTGNVVVKAKEWRDMHVHVSSYNTFPTAAGLASSAAGYAALVASLSSLFCAKETFPGELSTIARQGSGSACRSMYGGFVAWEKGLDTEDGHDSVAVQIADENHWPEFRALILVVSDTKKETSSTTGMQTSVATSSLISHRASHIVPARMKAITDAILSKDFPKFAEITMKESNQFHAVCLDTFPPIFYLNETSKFIMQLVHAYNDWAGELRVAYTFDAGPNAVLYTLDKYHLEMSALILYCFASDPDSSLFTPPSIQFPKLDPTLLEVVPKQQSQVIGAVKNVYVTELGSGPILNQEDSLIDLQTGLNLYSP